MSTLQNFFSLISLLIFFSFSSHLSAQTSNKDIAIIKSWTGLIEAGTECEVYYSFVQCGNEKIVLLKFYNEVPFQQNIKVKVTVKYSGYRVTEAKTVSINPNQTIVGACNSTDENLFIKLPTPIWDFDKTTIEVISLETKN
ncbi:hypothetical protein [Aridibaculum aurantiacum]|uniref:hypothetical protein n=1 Tax=Aridibaculum aurantiacum TaxID=2810307 RepID=UPI001A965B3F|nr:hypothetical protein [Aridibaculum aurantiacum]